MIGIIITTINNPSILKESINSCKECLPEGKIIVVRQTDGEYDSVDGIEDIYVPFDSGLSYSRNIGVEKAIELGCDEVLIMADSIVLINGDNVRQVVNTYKTDYDLVGLGLSNRIRWEGSLDLVQGRGFKIKIAPFFKEGYTKCDIVRNFFIAKTQTLYDVMWDNNLKMREHEDFFWRYKNKGYRVCYSPLMCGNYQGRNSDSYYERLRRKNMFEGLNVLKEKYGIQSWLI